MRLDKLLRDLQLGSRSELKTHIKNGAVTVNGVLVKNADYKVNPEADEILYHGRQISYEPLVYYMLNKPAGVVCATTDNLHKTVLDLLKEENRRHLFPIGRLDIDTEGLLLLTNDGQLAHRLLSPKRHVNKVYFARLDKPVTAEEIKAFREGFSIGDKLDTLPADLEPYGEEKMDALVTITEGRYHQVKRMFAVFGQEVLFLKRIAVGALTLDETLEVGAYRRLQQKEIEGLRQ